MHNDIKDIKFAAKLFRSNLRWGRRGVIYRYKNDSFFNGLVKKELFMDKYIELMGTKDYMYGSFLNDELREIEKILPERIENSAETGCGKSTVLLSNISDNHVVFTLDDSGDKNSSVSFFSDCPLTKRSKIKTVFGPTQISLREYTEHKAYDIVLLDGPHAYPFPDFEYLVFYPFIKKGGYLIIDDVHLPTVGRMADVIAEDEMFDLVAVIRNTAIFCRTNRETFCPTGDQWGGQNYNRRRVPWFEYYLNDGARVYDKISSLY
jgi:hypothetical protein